MPFVLFALLLTLVSCAPTATSSQTATSQTRQEVKLVQRSANHEQMPTLTETRDNIEYSFKLSDGRTKFIVFTITNRNNTSVVLDWTKSYVETPSMGRSAILISGQGYQPDQMPSSRTLEAYSTTILTPHAMKKLTNVTLDFSKTNSSYSTATVLGISPYLMPGDGQTAEVSLTYNIQGKVVEHRFYFSLE